VLHKIQPAGFLKTIFTSGRMLLRILPDLNAQIRTQQNDVDAVNTEQDHFNPIINLELLSFFPTTSVPAHMNFADRSN
jgi:hypothetical protein